MKIIATLTLPAIFVYATRELMLVCLRVFGPCALVPALIQWQSFAYVALSAFVAALGCVIVYVLCFGQLTLGRAAILGVLGLTYGFAYDLFTKGWFAFSALIAQNPLHATAAHLFIVAAFPTAALAARLAANYSFKATVAGRGENPAPRAAP